MTITHIGPSLLPISFRLGGATERRMRETAARQAQAGDRVIIYSAEDRDAVSEYQGAEVRAIACSRQGVLRAAEFLVRSLRDAAQFKPDIIHFHTVSEGATFARYFAGGVRAKTVLSFDFFEFRRGKKNPFFSWYRHALRAFGKLLPVSEYCRRESASYWSIPPEEMTVLYNGVSLQQFFPNPEPAAKIRSSLGIGPEELVLLYVGRVCRQKGTDLLADAFARLRTSRRNVRLVVAGPVGQFGHEGSDEITRALQSQHGLYLGPVDVSDLPSIYNMADVFVLPTRSHEMFGMAAIEAQACGRPVVCSDQGGLPEVVNPSSGLLFQPGDVDGLTRRLQTLLDDSAMRRRFSEAAVLNARRFAWESITAQLQEVYLT